MNIEELDVEIPDDSKELKILREQIDNLYTDVTFYYERGRITQKKYNQLKEKVEDVIYAIADLSIPYFRLGDKLRDYYITKHKKDPKLGRDKYLERYHSLHEPYDLLKNKCYVLFRKLDKIKNIE